jgi:hypothetical protein
MVFFNIISMWLFLTAHASIQKRQNWNPTQPWFTIDVTPPGKFKNIVYLEDWGVAENNTDNTDLIQQAIDTCALNQSGCVITFRTSGKVYKVNGGKRYQSIIFRNTSDLEFNGNQNTLLFSRPSFSRLGQIGIADSSCVPMNNFQPWKRGPIIRRGLFSVDNVQRAYFGNVKLGWDWSEWPLASLVTVLTGSDAKTWIMEFTDLKAQNLSIDLNTLRGYRSLTSVDSALKFFGHENGNEVFAPPSKPIVTQLSPTSLKLEWDRATASNPVINQTYLLRHITYDLHMWVVNNSTDISWDKLLIDSCPGKMYTVNEDCQRLSFTEMSMDLGTVTHPESPALQARKHLTCASDAIFLLGTRDVYVKDVRFGHLGDDCINALDATTRTGPSTQGPGPGKTLGRITLWNDSCIGIGGNWYNTFRPGDVLTLLNGNTYNFLGNHSVESVQSDGCGTYNVCLSPPLPNGYGLAVNPSPTDVGPKVLDGVVLVNQRLRGGNVLVDNLVCHNTRARGVLLQTRDAILQNSHLWNISQTCAIVRSNFYEKEGAGTRNTMLANNLLEQCDLLGWFAGGGVDVFGWTVSNTPVATMNGSLPPNENVVIKNNDVVNVRNSALHLSVAKSVLVEGNLFKQDFAGSGTNGKITIQGVDDVIVSRNVFVGSSMPVVFVNASDGVVQSDNVLTGKPVRGEWTLNPNQPVLPRPRPSTANLPELKSPGPIKYPTAVCSGDVNGVPEMDNFNDCIAARFADGWQPTSWSTSLLAHRAFPFASTVALFML